MTILYDFRLKNISSKILDNFFKFHFFSSFTSTLFLQSRHLAYTEHYQSTEYICTLPSDIRILILHLRCFNPNCCQRCLQTIQLPNYTYSQKPTAVTLHNKWLPVHTFYWSSHPELKHITNFRLFVLILLIYYLTKKLNFDKSGPHCI